VRIDGVAFRSVEPGADQASILVFDQTLLPWRVERIQLRSVEDCARAITTMQVRGAPLIGAVAAYGVAIGLRSDPSDAGLDAAVARLGSTRPTAVNLAWALARMTDRIRNQARADRAALAWAEAAAICEDDVATCEAIGRNALPLIEEVAATRRSGASVNVLTHCNAGWIATVDWGTALAPIYLAHDQGIAVHVWVDETRPRNQGALLTAWELGRHGVPHTVIADNAGGHLMQHGEVDLVIVGTDRVTRNGDVANKIGTYLKALAAFDNQVPFWVACPHSTIDWSLAEGRLIPIEERAEAEVTEMVGEGATRLRVVAPGSRAANPAFDVTPARLVTGLVTERGRCAASEAGLRALYPERST